MSFRTADWMLPGSTSSPAWRRRPKRCKVRVHRLNRRRRLKEGVPKMELRNLKLYLENRSIIEENRKLRQKALLLHQENRALVSEFQKKFPNLNEFSTPLPHCNNKK